MITIEEFKKNCEEKRVSYDARVNFYEELKKSQEKYDPRCYSPKFRFNWKYLKSEPICPVCEKVLNIEIVRTVENRGISCDDIILSCLCGYNYATTR